MMIRTWLGFTACCFFLLACSSSNNHGGGAGGTPGSGGAAGGSQGTGGATDGSQGTGGSVLLDAARSLDGSPEPGFITWTYHKTPMGLYVPPSTGKPLPVVMYLHACHNDPVYADYWLIPAVSAMESCAVFLPTAPPLDDKCADWGGTYDSALRSTMKDALTELDRVMGKFGFDSKRQYVYGESMGAEGVYRLLVDFPTRFAGAVAAAGYTLDAGASQMAQTPLWIFHGSEDSINPVENDRTIYKSILNAGGTQVKYTEYQGADHVPAIEQARSEPGLLKWLLAQRRN